MRRTDGWIAAGWAVLGATGAVGVAAMVTAVEAQEPPPVGGFGGGRGGFGGGQGQPGMGPRAFTPAPPAMTATDRHVYVLRGNTLYQFDVNGLKLVGQAQLPEMPPGGRPGGGRASGNP